MRMCYLWCRSHRQRGRTWPYLGKIQITLKVMMKLGGASGLVAFSVILVSAVALCIHSLGSALLVNLAYPEIVRAYLKEESAMAPACGADRHIAEFEAAYASQGTKLLPTSSRAWLALGRARWLGGECQAAVDAWRTAIDLSTDQDILTHLELARSLDLMGERHQAVPLFREIGAEHYLYRLANSKRYGGYIDAARELYELAFEVEPLPEVADALGKIYLAKGEMEQAVQMWQPIAEPSPIDQPIHWLALGEKAKVQEDWSGARLYFEKAIELSPEPYQLYLRLGRMFFQAREWPAVIRVSEKAVQLNPGVPQGLIRGPRGLRWSRAIMKSRCNGVSGLWALYRPETLGRILGPG